VDITTIITAGLSSITALGVAYIGVHQRREARDAALRQEGSLTQMEMSQATLNLSLCTAKAVMGQHVNGDMEEAMEWAKKVKIKQQSYLRRCYQEIKDGG
jgi:hypothetical protein